MCLFITVFVLRSSKGELISDIAKNHHLNWMKVENSFVLKQMNGAYNYFCTTNGMCDCDTNIGSNYHRDAKKFNVVRKKQKGWSDTKIQRWLEQKESKNEATKTLKDNELQNWIGFIKESLARRLTKEIGLLVHMYSKDVNNENFQLKEILKFTKVNEDILLNIENDKVYIFK